MELTRNEKVILDNVLDRFIDNMKWDTHFQEYKGDPDNWVELISKKDMNILKKIKEKIC